MVQSPLDVEDVEKHIRSHGTIKQQDETILLVSRAIWCQLSWWDSFEGISERIDERCSFGVWQ